jgi:hypothetical protein
MQRKVITDEEEARRGVEEVMKKVQRSEKLNREEQEDEEVKKLERSRGRSMNEGWLTGTKRTEWRKGSREKKGNKRRRECEGEVGQEGVTNKKDRERSLRRNRNRGG